MNLGLIDTTKRLRTRLLDFTVPQRFVFHHVPKCGGTSVGRALRRRYILSQATVTPESSFRAFADFTGRSDRDRMLVDVLDLREQMLLYLMHEDVRGVSLHVRFSKAAFERFSGRYRFITVLRDPVDRFISHYNWSHGRPGSHAHIAETFDDFLTTPRAQRTGATYVEYFCGLPTSEDIRSDHAVTSAIGNLERFDAVGRLDDLADFQRQLRRVLGVRIAFGHENAAAQRPGLVHRNNLSKEQLARIGELCAPDLAVWNAVAARPHRAP